MSIRAEEEQARRKADPREAMLGQIDAYFASNPVGSDPRGQAKNQGQALLADLNAYFVAVGEQNCPSPDEF